LANWFRACHFPVFCGEKRNTYKILVGKPEGKRQLGRPRRRWVDNIKMDLRDIGRSGKIWFRIRKSGGLL
jgi:hypothetical protein